MGVAAVDGFRRVWASCDVVIQGDGMVYMSTAEYMP